MVLADYMGGFFDSLSEIKVETTFNEDILKNKPKEIIFYKPDKERSLVSLKTELEKLKQKLDDIIKKPLDYKVDGSSFFLSQRIKKIEEIISNRELGIKKNDSKKTVNIKELKHAKVNNIEQPKKLETENKLIKQNIPESLKTQKEESFFNQYSKLIISGVIALGFTLYLKR